MTPLLDIIFILTPAWTKDIIYFGPTLHFNEKIVSFILEEEQNVKYIAVVNTFKLW